MIVKVMVVLVVMLDDSDDGGGGDHWKFVMVVMVTDMMIRTGAVLTAMGMMPLPIIVNAARLTLRVVMMKVLRLLLMLRLRLSLFSYLCLFFYWVGLCSLTILRFVLN